MKRGQSGTHNVGWDEDQWKPDQVKSLRVINVSHALMPHLHAIDERMPSDRAVRETEGPIEDVDTHDLKGWKRLGNCACQLGDAGPDV